MYTLLTKFAFYYFKIFCTATMTFEIVVAQKNLRNWHFKYSKIGLFYNIFYSIASIILHYFGIKFLYENDAQYKRIKFDRIFDSIQDVLNLTTSIIISLTFCFYQNKIVTLLNNIMAIRKSLSNNNNSANDKKVMKSIVQVFTVAIFMWSALICTVIVYGFRYVPFFLDVYSSKIVVSTLLVQYTTALIVIEECYSTMNNRFASLSTMRLNKCQGKIRKIAQLRKVHLMLTKVTTELSSFYSRPMLFCVFNTFSELICASYFLIKPIFINNSFLPVNRALHCFLYGTLYMSTMIFLTKYATAVINEVVKIFKYVKCLLLF